MLIPEIGLSNVMNRATRDPAKNGVNRARLLRLETVRTVESKIAEITNYAANALATSPAAGAVTA